MTSIDCLGGTSPAWKQFMACYPQHKSHHRLALRFAALHYTLAHSVTFWSLAASPP